MEMQSCESSSIEAVGHDGKTLRVKYKSGGTYDFHGVTADQFKDLLAAKSIGKHLHGMGLKTGLKHNPKGK